MEKKRYSDEELEEFRAIINDKLAVARKSYNDMMRQLTYKDSNDVQEAKVHPRFGSCTGKNRKQDLRHRPLHR